MTPAENSGLQDGKRSFRGGKYASAKNYLSSRSFLKRLLIFKKLPTVCCGVFNIYGCNIHDNSTKDEFINETKVFQSSNDLCEAAKYLI